MRTKGSTLAGLFVVLAVSAILAYSGIPAVQSLPVDLLQNQDSMTLTSPAFKEGDRMPPRYTCDGADVSPPLNWTGAPIQTVSFALIVDDPNAAGWAHWVIFNIPATISGLPEAVPSSGKLPNNAIQGTNDFGQFGYNGPCPPGTHHYVFHLYALDSTLSLPPGTSKRLVLQSIQGHVLADATLTALYR